MRSIAVLLVCLSVLDARASLEGVPADLPIRASSRPCCAFIPSFVTRIFGLSGFADPTRLGDHDFAQRIRKKKWPAPAGYREEEFGAVYTCRGGFIDLSHLRDNADWYAQILLALRSGVGTGTRLELRHEGGSKRTTLELPRLSAEERARISDEDLERLAMSLTFDLALFHEIATSFPMGVSGPGVPILSQYVFNERNSAFSVEDSYSNLLGAHLGREAVRSPLPFGPAMTKILREEMQELGALSPEGSRQVIRSVRGDWWKSGVYRGYKGMRRRVYDYAGTLHPRLAETPAATELCSARESTPAELEIFDANSVLGRPHREVAYLQIELNREFARRLRHLGVPVAADGTLTRDDFAAVIPRLRERYARKIRGLRTE